jgi:DNA polymerase III subunit gamma/tau
VELYLKHRPAKFSEIVGQEEIVKTIKDLAIRDEIPHAILLSGPSGTGKTTIARILRKALRCSDTDFIEMNSADIRGIDNIRSISQQMGTAAIGGRSRIWLIDEAHGLTPQAQDAFLKTLEDTPSHVYFILSTTNPSKLRKTIITRCTEFKLKLLNDDEISDLVAIVAKKEGLPLHQSVKSKIIEVAEGSGRKALVLLNTIMGCDTAEEQIDAIEKTSTTKQAIEICRALMRPDTKWNEMATILRSVEEEPETIRRIILGYCKAVLLKTSNATAASIIEEFRDPLYDIGTPGLVASCWNIINSKS